MSSSTGWKVFATAFVVAIIMGSLGFATGYLVYYVKDTASENPVSTVVVEITSTPEPVEELPSPDSASEVAPQPTEESMPQPTISAAVSECDGPGS